MDLETRLEERPGVQRDLLVSCSRDQHGDGICVGIIHRGPGFRAHVCLGAATFGTRERRIVLEEGGGVCAALASIVDKGWAITAGDPVVVQLALADGVRLLPRPGPSMARYSLLPVNDRAVGAPPLARVEETTGITQDHTVFGCIERGVWEIGGCPAFALHRCLCGV